MAKQFSDIPGMAELETWFEGWPTFHDAEILSICLNRQGDSTIEIYVFESGPAVDATGHFVRRKEATVTFILRDITDLRLEGFSHQNVIFGLKIEGSDGNKRLEWEETFGIGGFIEA